MKIFRQLLADEQASSMNEYALILALIAIATVISITALRETIVGTFSTSSTSMGSSLDGVAMTIQYAERIN